MDHLARILIHSPRLRPLPRSFTRADRLTPVDVVFFIGRSVLDKHPFECVMTLRTAQEIMHMWTFSAVA
jgi:hypothetical protein